jgi:hypothetical protein
MGSYDRVIWMLMFLMTLLLSILTGLRYVREDGFRLELTVQPLKSRANEGIIAARPAVNTPETVERSSSIR